jgi:diguanylate cyclase (GGDEF)-like protein
MDSYAMPQGWPASLAFVTVAACIVAALDLATHRFFPAELLYLVPIALVTRAGGKRYAAASALLCTVFCVYTDWRHGMLLQPSSVPWALVTHAVCFGVVGYFLASFRQQELDLRQAALTDPLTAIGNRRAFELHLHQSIESSRATGSPFAVVLADIDDFKKVNDRFGHAAGDALLARTARVLSAHTRSHDLVARIGGDEFALLPRDVNLLGARAAMARAQAELGARHGKAPPVSCSMGIVEFDRAPESVQVAMARVDAAMYAAKNERKRAPVLPAEHSVPATEPAPIFRVWQQPGSRLDVRMQWIAEVGAHGDPNSGSRPRMYQNA